jgi:hypothetical protein
MRMAPALRRFGWSASGEFPRQPREAVAPAPAIPFLGAVLLTLADFVAVWVLFDRFGATLPGNCRSPRNSRPLLVGHDGLANRFR